MADRNTPDPARADVPEHTPDGPDPVERRWRRPLDESLRDAYLRRLGWTAPPPPTAETLVALHRAHVERVPYEVVWIALGESRTVEPLESVRHVVAGRGGYCYHLNGAFACLLDWLGFDVHWRVGGVQLLRESEPFRARANHLALEVHGLPSAASPEGRWFVDTGLGDALHEPLPLVPGGVEQPPSRFALRRSAVVPGGWRLDHDPRGYFVGMDFTSSEATVPDFAAMHEKLSTAPDSGFVRVVSVCRRDGRSVSTLRGLRYTELRAESTTQTAITTKAQYFAVLADVFGLPLSDVDDQRRAALWAHLLAAHERYLAERADRVDSTVGGTQ
ncbi:arylamine N-acetyltransferase family protein [Actinokineospora enzanensis]|uniref:arylamine N-acetyltransferase family protein n=1 Tax=Actinokineospora enzanensis TaxID=155975 RepID=UPI00035C3AA1|nr:arylamine N-acetyltransferase [Actinokineospora enzanensis]